MVTALKRPPLPADVYLAVKIGFMQRRTTLTEWCAANGIHRTYAIQCLTGMRKGPRAQELRRRILVAAGQPVDG